MNTLKLLVFGIACLLFSNAYAQDFTFTFTNPSFGGNAMNGSYLLQSAQAQSEYKEKIDLSSENSQLEDFATNLNNQILYRLADAIVQQQFGLNSSVKDGDYQVGKYKINIGRGSNGVNITIFDTSNSNQTIIQVPYY
jgi:curli production assembly/transport component CsgF